MTIDELRDDLKTVDGIGDAKADAILDVLNDHTPKPESNPYVEKAKDAANSGDYRAAGIYLQRAGGSE